MICTEKEAKTKQCRVPMLVIMQNTLLTIESCNTLFPNCVASGCMMWEPTDNICKPQYPGDPKAKSKPAGYCGLTRGKP